MKKLVEDLKTRKSKIAVVGLGYVGLPLAVEFGKKFDVIGLDISDKRVQELQRHIDHTGELSSEELSATSVFYTTDAKHISDAHFIIVTVPTPVDPSNKPDLTPVIKASESIGKYLQKGSVVVYESTVYPGVTEDVCVPLLEKASGLTCGTDFKMGYSPERINPGDKVHTVTKILKIVSGQDEETLNIVAAIYGSIITAGIFKASSIKVAEAAKVIENTQRDLNIALMNELAVICNKMGINTLEVIEAAGTKWNFIKMTPGLVGGHCIGVDPYYLTHKAEMLGYTPQVILAGRRINNNTGKYIAEQTVKLLIKAGKQVKHAKVAILGFTFKENVSDIRNTKVIDVVRELEDYGVCVFATDPLANPAEAHHEYGITLVPYEDISDADAIILATPHEYYQTQYTLKTLGEKITQGTKIFVDIKGVFRKTAKEDYFSDWLYWNL